MTEQEKNEALFALAKALATVTGGYREVAERIVERAGRQRYLLAKDRAHLAALNSQVEAIVVLLLRKPNEKTP